MMTGSWEGVYQARLARSTDLVTNIVMQDKDSALTESSEGTATNRRNKSTEVRSTHNYAQSYDDSFISLTNNSEVSTSITRRTKLGSTNISNPQIVSGETEYFFCYRWKFHKFNMKFAALLVLIYTVTTSSVISRKTMQVFLSSMYSIDMKLTNSSQNELNPTNSISDWNTFGMSDEEDGNKEKQQKFLRTLESQSDIKFLDRQNQSDAALVSSKIFNLSEVRHRYVNVESDLDVGVLSNKDSSFFRALQDEVDGYENGERCARYGGWYNHRQPTKRRLFYGTLTASEPWELVEIVASEVYGIYTGLVFVEGNRTQNLTPRKPQRLHHTETLKQLFGSDRVQVRLHVYEGRKRLDGLSREHAQRAEIIIGWKELGMTEHDVGILADFDETFSRDFLRAVQGCDGLLALQYDKHHCHYKSVKLIGTTRVYESTPECVTDGRVWFHPDMILGKCIEGIASADSIHKPALRTPDSFVRAPGWGSQDGDWEKYDSVQDYQYPLWNAADFRRTPGGQFYPLKSSKLRPIDKTRLPDPNNLKYDRYTAYHLHNFFYNFTAARFKYKTYGHPDKIVDIKRIEEISNDFKMMFRCVMDLPDEETQKWKRVIGGYNYTYPFYPIYFQDQDYRIRRTMHVKNIVIADEEMMLEKIGKRNESISSNLQVPLAPNKTDTLTNESQLQLTIRANTMTPGTSLEFPSVAPLVTGLDFNVVRAKYKRETEDLDIGVLSKKENDFFRQLQDDIDQFDNIQRCRRYGGTYKSKNPASRRIFYGALTASEPWELYEIVASEVYGIYSGMVFVEGNRTQNLTPRIPQRLHHVDTFKELFGVDNVQVRLHVHEATKLEGLAREHAQRSEIIKGWKEIGMTEYDIGIIADSDETFTRDFLRAVQVCDGMKHLEYESHYCNFNFVKIVASTRVYESTPECITKDRVWFHPDMIIGKCIDGIAAENSIHKSAPRQPNSFLRAEGWGADSGLWSEYVKIKNNSYPLWNAADFRRTPGGSMLNLKSTLRNREKENPPVLGSAKYDKHIAYHFHNFFYNFTAARFKYKTYGHPDRLVDTKRIEDISNDLKMMSRCVLNKPDEDTQVWKRVVGGFNYTHPFYPIYFQDDVYRQERTAHVKAIVIADEAYMMQRQQAETATNQSSIASQS